MIKNDREYRDFSLGVKQPEENEEERMIVKGYASTFNDGYTLWEDEDYKFIEVVDRNAFANTDMTDVIFQYDHNGRVFARKSNGTLLVEPDERGLYIEADLGGTEIGRNLYEEIKGGYTTKMSFGFTVEDDAYDERTEDDKRIITRTITQVGKLFDVSAVSLPANDGTSISVRNLTDGVINQIKAERLKALEAERMRLIIRSRLMR